MYEYKLFKHHTIVTRFRCRKFHALLAKQLRVAINGFLEKVDLVLETIQQFGPPRSKIYEHYA